MEIRCLTASDPKWDRVAEYAEKCSWRAGASLAGCMRAGFQSFERVFAAIEGDNIAGYCTFMERDCIPDAPYSPYIGFVFVGEEYRGRRLSEKLIAAARRYAASLGYERVYLVSDHDGLYEKYGFTVADRMTAPWGSLEKIYTIPSDS